MRFAVHVEFRLAAARNTNEVWDLDNLIKATLDAMRAYSARAGGGVRRRQRTTGSTASTLPSARRAGAVSVATIDVGFINLD
jgi:hypothetical protein